MEEIKKEQQLQTADKQINNETTFSQEEFASKERGVSVAPVENVGENKSENAGGVKQENPLEETNGQKKEETQGEDASAISQKKDEKKPTADGDTKQEVEQKEEKPKPQFITYGGDVKISDEEYIMYYKTRYKFLTAMFKLVGRFDSRGIYIISEDVKRELLKMVKEIERSGEDGYKATTTFFGKEYKFSVEISNLDEGKAKASLYLEEYVGKTLKDEYIRSHIADFVDDADDDFRIKVRKIYNLSDVSFPLNEFEYPNISIIMQNYIDLDLVVGELFDMASQIFLLRLLKELESTAEGREIISKYKALLDGSENDIKRKFTYLRMLLEKVIDENGGYEKLGLSEEKKKKLLQDLLLSIQNLKKRVAGQEVPVVEVQKTEKKEAKPASGGGKKPAKKPAKKADKKADKKGKGKAKKKSEKKSDNTQPIVFYIEEKKVEKKEQTNSDKPEKKQSKSEDKVKKPTVVEGRVKVDDFGVEMYNAKAGNSGGATAENNRVEEENETNNNAELNKAITVSVTYQEVVLERGESAQTIEEEEFERE